MQATRFLGYFQARTLLTRRTDRPSEDFRKFKTVKLNSKKAPHMRGFNWLRG